MQLFEQQTLVLHLEVYNTQSTFVFWATDHVPDSQRVPLDSIIIFYAIGNTYIVYEDVQ